MLNKLLQDISLNKKGIEIGGPSDSGIVIYKSATMMDNVIFSNDTVWSKHDETYKYFPNKVGKVIINDAVNISGVADSEYDFCFASHILEHVANPIKALKEWLRIIKSDGHIVLSVPEKSVCFDWKRQYSSFDTLVSQYEKGVGEDDLSTLPEILENHDLTKDLPAGTYEQFKERSLNNINNRCLHHYVYNPDLLKQLCNYLGCEFVYTETKGIYIWFVMKKIVVPKIVGYIHICQKPGWQRSFDLLINSVTKNGLYEATDEIRLGIVNDDGKVVPDERLNDPKFNIIYVGRSLQFERPTVLHMRAQAEYETCNYWYLQTKGLRHFDTPREKSILCWIDILLYWNVVKWRDAVKKLKTYDTYSCLYQRANDFFKHHYSGNFWWATSKQVVKLPKTMGTEYIAAETYILSNNPKFFNAYSHKFISNYFINIPPSAYNTLPVTEHILPGNDLIRNIEPVNLCPPHLLGKSREEIFGNIGTPVTKPVAPVAKPVAPVPTVIKSVRNVFKKIA
jgi:SAM-dependent methyltransferase